MGKLLVQVCAFLLVEVCLGFWCSFSSCFYLLKLFSEAVGSFGCVGLMVLEAFFEGGLCCLWWGGWGFWICLGAGEGGLHYL